MKNIYLFKVAAVVVVLIMATVSLTIKADINRKIKVVGPDEETSLGVFDATNVSFIEVTDAVTVTNNVYPNAIIAKNGDIFIQLTPQVNFRMIKVDGGVDYALQSTGSSWTTSQSTKTMETFYLGQFEVTQGLWKEVYGSLPSKKQSKEADNCPVEGLSWDIITQQNGGFLKLINTKLTQIKENNPAVATLLGSRNFRLPNEWEWEYAAAGGKDYATLNYYYSGTSSSVGLDKVAVRGGGSIAPVGSKLPNALGLYDMSGNVAEYCSGLGYLSNPTTAGYQLPTGSFNTSYRPYRGGSYSDTASSKFEVSDREASSPTLAASGRGFRLAL